MGTLLRVGTALRETHVAVSKPVDCTDGSTVSFIFLIAALRSPHINQFLNCIDGNVIRVSLVGNLDW